MLKLETRYNQTVTLKDNLNITQLLCSMGKSQLGETLFPRDNALVARPEHHFSHLLLTQFSHGY